MPEVFLLPAARKELDSLEKADWSRIHARILALAANPRPAGSQKLSGDGGYRIRAGDFRILYRIDDAAGKIFVYRVKHRREVYR